MCEGCANEAKLCALPHIRNEALQGLICCGDYGTVSRTQPAAQAALVMHVGGLKACACRRGSTSGPKHQPASVWPSRQDTLTRHSTHGMCPPLNNPPSTVSQRAAASAPHIPCCHVTCPRRASRARCQRCRCAQQPCLLCRNGNRREGRLKVLLT